MEVIVLLQFERKIWSLSRHTTIHSPFDVNVNLLNAEIIATSRILILNFFLFQTSP